MDLLPSARTSGFFFVLISGFQDGSEIICKVLKK